MCAVHSPTFGGLLKRHRRAAGLTQEELAERAGLSARAVGDLERGVRQPRKDTLQMLLVALQLAPDEEHRLEAAARTGSLSSVGAGAGSVRQTGSFLGALPPGPLIGRQREMQRVVAIADTVLGGSGRFVLLAGEPGVGKTRLAQEIAVETERRGFLVATGRAYEPEQTVPFYPFREALAAAYTAAPRGIKEDALRLWPYLGWLLPEEASGALPPSGSAGTGGQEEQQRLFRAVSAFLRAVAEDMPVAVLLDDLHSADSTSLKLLLHLARHTRNDRVLLLGTYRDVEINRQHPLERALVDLNRERLVERLTVRRLPPEGTAELIAATLGGQDIPPEPELVALVHRATSGNAFFIQEVLRALVDRGDIYGGNGRWKRREIPEIRAPESVRAAIAERLGRLRPEAQSVLYEASVLGQTFSFEDVRALTGRLEEEVEGALDSAVSDGLIRETAEGGYAFNHALTQAALYAELSMRRRQRLHLAAGEALHHLPEWTRQRRASELARHFKEGGDRERAVSYSMLAGEQAEAVLAYGEAERHFRTALDLLTPADQAPGDRAPSDDSTLRAVALARLGRVLNITERYDEALDALERAASLYAAVGDGEGEGLTIAEIGWVHNARGTAEEGIRRIRPSIDVLERTSDILRQRRVLAALYTALARLYFGLGRYQEELDAGVRAVELAREVGDDLVLAVARARQGAALMTLGRWDEAGSVLEEAVALAQATGNLGTMSVALDNLGEIARDGGDYRRSEAYFTRAVEVAEQTGVASRVGWTMTKLGRLHLLQGQWSSARRNLERAIQLLGDASSSAAYPRLHLAELALLEGTWDEGMGQVEGIVAAAGSRGDMWLVRCGQALLAERDLLIGRASTARDRLTPLVDAAGAGEPQVSLLFAPLICACLDLGREDEAEALLSLGMEQVRARTHRPAQADLLRVKGMMRTRQGAWEEADEALKEGLDLAGAMPDPYREAQLRVEVGTLAARMGETDRARGHLHKSLAALDRLGARPAADRVRRLLSELDRTPR